MPPRLHAIFHRQIPGDHALLRLAQARFRAAGLNAEFYPTSPDRLAEELAYRPLADQPVTVHLPRNLRVLDAGSHDAICTYAWRFAGDACGLVVHDQPETASRFDDYVAAVRRLDGRLRTQGPGPTVFIEYAAGVPVEAYTALFEAVRDCPRIGACIDISHIGIRQCQLAWEKAHPGEDICRLKWHSPELPRHIEEVQAACATALPVVCRAVAQIARLGRPLHFHLHDGHPASTFSAYGVSDHLSFLFELVVPFSYCGSRTLPLLYGPMGLKKVIDTARAALSDELLSCTLEVHAPDGRLDLGEWAGLFSHWRDRENAERTNHWIEVLLRCAALVRQAWG
jgi:hypothetical protein